MAGTFFLGTAKKLTGGGVQFAAAKSGSDVALIARDRDDKLAGPRELIDNSAPLYVSYRRRDS